MIEYIDKRIEKFKAKGDRASMLVVSELEEIAQSMREKQKEKQMKLKEIWSWMVVLAAFGFAAWAVMR